MEGRKSALMVIDMQVGPFWGTYHQEQTIGNIKNIIEKAEHERVDVFYLQFEDEEMLKQGTPFWQFVPGISPRAEDMIIPKRAADSFYQTLLREELNKRNITDLVITGVRTDYCIDTTCRSALSHGYEVTLVADGHTTVDVGLSAEHIIHHHNVNLSKVSVPGRSIVVLPAAEVHFGE